MAVKLLSHALDPNDRVRFQREGQVSASLDHPHIVRVHGSGVAAGGRPYLVYELVVDARTLADGFRAGALAARVEWVRQVAEALGHAHARGVVHRDVKPENVLIDREGRARLTDFGIALAVEADRLTETGAVVGTPSHMAPEQIQGRRDRIGPATDVWALGVLLYEALTGCPPFRARSFLALADAIVNHPPERPSLLAPEVAPAVEAVCLRALQRDPGQRHPDANAFGRDLVSALRGEGGGPPVHGRVVAAAGVVLGVVFVLLLVAGLGVPPVAQVVPSPQPTSTTAVPAPPVRPAPTPARAAARSQHRPQHVFSLHDPTALAFLEGDRVLLTSNGRAEVWRAEGQTWTREWSVIRTIYSVAVGGDHCTFALLHEGGIVSVRSVLQLAAAWQLSFPDTTRAIAIDPKTSRIAGGGIGPTVTIRSILGGAKLEVAAGVTRPGRSTVWCMAFPSPKDLVVGCGRPPQEFREGSEYDELVFVNRFPPRVTGRVRIPNKPVRMIAASDLVAYGDRRGSVLVRIGEGGAWVTIERSDPKALLSHRGRISGLAYDAKRGRLFSCSASSGLGNDLALWALDRRAGRFSPAQPFLDAKEQYEGLAIDRAGERLLVGWKETVELWRIEDALRTPQRPTSK